ncbi:DivIVA domain-containing protein [Kribbella sp. VKM Ac-2571]|uniref:DivIVA domain-containing protein n=1 Tax=Kribbella sp. VKM Ac-2571 TaxID=2512222 RepID=UPI0010EA8A98|nr:DivIVA domain-containing protein [Kribbella sp. VKM Ac-2571]TDO64198.1 DivIVA domain-containing protein [Kribbella sp. VKM Ac-2571]
MWFFGLIVVLLIGAVAVVASGRWGAMSTAYDDRPDMTVPARQALTATDIESARFAVGVRGYRMDEVDTLLERVAKEVAERDRRIADLERAVAPIVEAPDGHGFSSRPYDPAEFEDTGTQPPILVGGPDPVTRPKPADEPTDPTDAEDTAQPSDTPEPAEAAGAPGVAGAAGAPDVPGTAGAAGAAGVAGGAESLRSDGGAESIAGGEASEARDSTSSVAPVGSGASSSGGEEEDDEHETTELPRAVQAAAEEYERLQAEARAVLEAQSQPVTPRRKPAPPQQTPAQQPQQDATPAEAPVEAPATHWTQQPPQEAQEQTQPQKPEQARQETPEAPKAEGNGAAGDGDEEGWRFWPPADQQGEGAYQRPS